MKKEELIKMIQELPDGVEICILDWKRNMLETLIVNDKENQENDFNEDKNIDSDNDDEENNAGIYPDFFVDMLTKEVIGEDTEPFAVIVFANPDIELDDDMQSFDKINLN